MTIGEYAALICSTYHLVHYDTIQFDSSGNFVEPPPGVALSDALVFLIVSCGTIIRDRKTKWPADFNIEGDIYAEHWRRAQPVVPWGFGLSFLPVHGDYYILCGSDLRPYHLQLTHKTKGKAPPHHSFRFGQVVGPL
ncbi:hypothetical protein N7465_007196 [Penicillium sp. CMV-2018d]|nr:hypothetical protein N7465_007196 [Penicillium sp. CMV-2018d]